jgi:hypothetical protein
MVHFMASFLRPLTCRGARFFANLKPFAEEDAVTAFALERNASDGAQQKFTETFRLADSLEVS